MTPVSGTFLPHRAGEASSPLHAGRGPGAARRPAELEATHLFLFQTPGGQHGAPQRSNPV